MTQGGCVDFYLYLTGQGQPGDRHVAVQHLELGLQRESHTGKKTERETNQSSVSGEQHFVPELQCRTCGNVITVVV